MTSALVAVPSVLLVLLEVRPLPLALLLGIAGGAGALVRQARPGRSEVLTAPNGAVLAVVLLGAELLAGASGPLLVAVLAAGGWALHRWYGRLVHRAVTPGGDPDLAHLHRVWTLAGLALTEGADPAAAVRLVQLRARVLDDLEQTAPDAVARWVSEGPRVGDALPPLPSRDAR